MREELTWERMCDFSPCGKYRFSLRIQWGSAMCRGAGNLNFIMCNPSTADAFGNDPTVERCERRARSMGFGQMIVTNLLKQQTLFAETLEGIQEFFDAIG